MHRLLRTGPAWLVAMLLLSNGPVAAQSGPAAEENPGPNINILRQARGHYVYQTLKDRRQRGVEDFQLLVHPDGSRTLIIWHDLWARNAQFSVILRVAEDFRPLSAFASYWVANGYKGNATMQLDGAELTLDTVGPAGHIRQHVEVPQRVSIGTHPVSGDGWHLWYADPAPGASGTLSVFNLEASADINKPMLGQLTPMDWQFIGNENLETPAGRFDAQHYRVLGSTDLWIHGEDRLLLRMVMERFDREYLLTELELTAH